MMDFKTFLTENDVAYKAPKGFFDDESMADDFSEELAEEDFEWDVDFIVSDDNKTVTFTKKVSSEVSKLLKSWGFKKV